MMKRFLAVFVLLSACQDTGTETAPYVSEFNGATVRVVQVSLSMTPVDHNAPAVVALAEKTCGSPVTHLGDKVLETASVAAHVGHLFKCGKNS